MQIDPALHTPADSYKILTSVVVPRPIAWITSLGPQGTLNLAPFSFFNAISGHPPCVVVSVGRRDDGSPKDTAVNIESRGEFVINMVTEELLAAMNISAADFPPDQSELTAAGLDVVPSQKIGVPRLAAAQASLECRLFKTLELGSNTIVIGEIVMLHVADQLVDSKLHMHGFAPIGRMGSPSRYCRTADSFELPRISHAQWLQHGG